MRKILNIIGTRPQYIKLAPVIKELNKLVGVENLVIDTGQHYDSELSELFIKEFGINVDYTIDAKSRTNCAQLALFIEKLEEIIKVEKPDYVLVYGDTNSTLAAAITSIKSSVPYGHIEAGVRSESVSAVQEEANRVLSDRLATHLFVTDLQCSKNLLNEGIAKESIFVTGDVMYDTFKMMSPYIDVASGGSEESVLVTVHRAENAESPERLKRISALLSKLALNYEVMAPLHPRTVNALKEYELYKELNSRINIMQPVSYVEILKLVKHSEFVISDSGGLPKEAAFLNKRSLLLRPDAVWTEYRNMGAFFCSDPSAKDFEGESLRIIKEFSSMENFRFQKPLKPASSAIAGIIQRYLG